MTMDLTKLEFRLHICDGSHRGDDKKFNQGFIWEISAVSKGFTARFGEVKIYGTKEDAAQAAGIFAAKYKLNIVFV